MIYWGLVKDFRTACKIITYMEYWEFEYLLHTSAESLVKKHKKSLKKVKLIKDAVKHYTDLKKLDSVTRGMYGEIPDVYTKETDGFVEFFIGDKRICGYPLKGKQAGVVCLHKAGRSTNHNGYGYCMDHEKLLPPDDRKKIWLELRRVHRAVPTMVDLLDRAQNVEEVAVKSMNADLSYLEIARQAIMTRAENNAGVMTRDMSMDLAIISETTAKVKALKVKTESINWIPPEKVGVLILQVLDAITKNEDEDVRRRLAERAKDLSNILVPVIDENPEIPQYRRDTEVKQALRRAEKYVPADWSEMPESTGYDPHKPKQEPAYRRNHRILKARRENGSGTDSGKETTS